MRVYGPVSMTASLHVNLEAEAPIGMIRCFAQVILPTLECLEGLLQLLGTCVRGLCPGHALCMGDRFCLRYARYAYVR